MGIMDKAKDKMKGMGDEMKGRFEELKGKERSGELDAKGREELQKLREKFGKKEQG